MADFAADFYLAQNSDAITTVEASDTTTACQSVIFVTDSFTVVMKSISGNPSMRLSKVTSGFEKLCRQNGQQRKATELFLSQYNFHYHYWFRFRIKIPRKSGLIPFTIAPRGNGTQSMMAQRARFVARYE